MSPFVGREVCAGADWQACRLFVAAFRETCHEFGSVRRGHLYSAWRVTTGWRPKCEVDRARQARSRQRGDYEVMPIGPSVIGRQHHSASGPPGLWPIERSGTVHQSHERRGRRAPAPRKDTAATHMQQYAEMIIVSIN